jgi:predicted N-acyltransferase
MTLTPTVYSSVTQIPIADWNAVVRDPSDLAMDLRLLDAFESTMRDQCRCWFVVFRDESQHPVAAACLARFDVDGLETTGPMSRAIAQRIRRAFPSYMRFGVLFCGLPLPSGASHLRWIDGADPREVTRSLDAVLQKLAVEHQARLVVVKELGDREIDELRGLCDLSYIRGDIPSSYELHQNFTNFDEYFRALQSGYRKQITRSQKRFHRAGGSIDVVTGMDIADCFTDELHSLYLATRKRAEYRMETYPAEFFREVGRRFGEDASLTLLRINDCVVGWTFGIVVGSEYHDLYIGINYDRNAEADVYFNLYYHDLDRVLRRGCTCVHMGQTSDEFKTRLGCDARELSFYVRATSPLVHAGLRRAARWVFPPVVRVTPRDIYLHPTEKKQRPATLQAR